MRTKRAEIDVTAVARNELAFRCASSRFIGRKTGRRERPPGENRGGSCTGDGTLDRSMKINASATGHVTRKREWVNCMWWTPGVVIIQRDRRLMNVGKRATGTKSCDIGADDVLRCK